MDKVAYYVGHELGHLLNMEGLAKELEYDKKKNTFIYHLENFRWIGYNNFIDLIVRKLIHNGLGNEFIEVSYKQGKENAHNFELLLYLKLFVELDTLAGYLRLMEGKRNG